MPPEKPQMESRNEDTDAKGNPRKKWNINDSIFYGSQEEYEAELEANREEGKI